MEKKFKSFNLKEFHPFKKWQRFCINLILKQKIV